MKSAIFSLLSALTFCAGTNACAGIFCSFEPDRQAPAWYGEAQTAVLFGVNNRFGYVLAPQMVSVMYDPAFESWAEGFAFGITAMAQPVVNGPETFLGGGAFAIRYDFTRFSASPKIRPYITTRLGCGGIDASGVRDGQAQDFVFILQAEAGVGFEIGGGWEAKVGVLYQHVSNAGLSEPELLNTGLDSVGPFIALRWNW